MSKYNRLLEEKGYREGVCKDAMDMLKYAEQEALKRSRSADNTLLTVLRKEGRNADLDTLVKLLAAPDETPIRSKAERIMAALQQDLNLAENGNASDLDAALQQDAQLDEHMKSLRKCAAAKHRVASIMRDEGIDAEEAAQRLHGQRDQAHAYHFEGVLAGCKKLAATCEREEELAALCKELHVDLDGNLVEGKRSVKAA